MLVYNNNNIGKRKLMKGVCSVKVNKKLVGSLIVGALLVSSGGLVMADDTVRWGNGQKSSIGGQMVKGDRPQARCLVLDELVKDNKITQQEADQYRETMQNNMNEWQTQRQQLKNEQLNANLDTMVSDGEITVEQANAIKEKFSNTWQEKMGKKQARMKVLQEPNFLSDLIAEGILSAKQAEAFTQKMCRFR